MLDYYFDWTLYILVKCPHQGSGNNFCGYYVCEFIRQRTYDKGRILEKLDVRKQYSQIYFITINCVEYRLRVIQEELAGFLLDHVIVKNGEYHEEIMINAGN